MPPKCIYLCVKGHQSCDGLRFHGSEPRTKRIKYVYAKFCLYARTLPSKNHARSFKAEHLLDRHDDCTVEEKEPIATCSVFYAVVGCVATSIARLRCISIYRCTRAFSFSHCCVPFVGFLSSFVTPKVSLGIRLIGYGYDAGLNACQARSPLVLNWTMTRQA